MDEPVPLLHYCNKKGKQVAVVITDHAKYRFLERYNLLFPDKNITISTAITYINYYWNTSSKLENLNKQEKLRLIRYGEDTLFFRSHCFTFIIQNAALITIEISSKNQRHLNKKKKRIL